MKTPFLSDGLVGGPWKEKNLHMSLASYGLECKENNEFS